MVTRSVTKFHRQFLIIHKYFSSCRSPRFRCNMHECDNSEDQISPLALCSSRQPWAWTACGISLTAVPRSAQCATLCGTVKQDNNNKWQWWMRAAATMRHIHSCSNSQFAAEAALCIYTRVAGTGHTEIYTRRPCFPGGSHVTMECSAT